MRRAIIHRLTYDALGNMVGEPLGTSDWHVVTQEAINMFADCTGDTQWIHIDVERAQEESPFGGPVAHGYLTLSMLSVMAMEIGVVPEGTSAAVNYGLNKVRFLAPVPAGSKLRLHSKLTGFEKKKNRRYLMTTENTMECAGSNKPVLTAESLAMLVREPDA
ncbi:Acyl dehydratase [Sulfitobacter noctilucicola]|uniref:Acyl dehydratase n=1 Tax=Sulfitobacter noctilucicola TaxID=1342301 RepID=A0A7W6M9L7_9RHOB|nr:MaoC family dehydratase [Sulfitobacter noctilucicola]KIN63495.1 Acyl dehydratase [Sulfitobacter noctilucicola]MBB4174994.1 acyl dehydratase [Sulfitobacter noctilucicola]